MGVFILAYWLFLAAGNVFKLGLSLLDSLAAATINTTTSTKRYIEKLWATEAAQRVKLMNSVEVDFKLASKSC
jgi:hypothetical protein